MSAAEPEVDLERSTLDRGDTRLHVVRGRGREAQAGAAPVLFLHGYPDTHATWSRQLAGLGARHPVASFDQRGVGDSTPAVGPQATRIARYLDDIEAVIDEVAGPDGQVHLVGHDWGGVLGWQFASDRARARRLRSFSAIAAPHPQAADAALRAHLGRHRGADLAFLADQLRRSWYILLFQLPRFPEWYLTRDVRSMWIATHRAGGLRRDDPELLEVDERRARSALTTPLTLYRQMFRGRPEAAGGAGGVEVPVCLIVPLRDMALRPELYAEVSRFVPDLETHHIDDNHWVHRTSALQVNEILHDFIARHER